MKTLIDQIPQIEEEYNINILYCTIVGSKLYGTDDENSDLDLRFIYTCDLKDIVLGKSEDTLRLTKVTDEKNTKDDIDYDGWSLNKFMNLLNKGDTLALEMYFSMFNDSKEHIIKENVKFTSVLKLNKDLILNNDFKSFIGYINSMSLKFGIKGEKLQEVRSISDYIDSLNYSDVTRMSTIYKDIESKNILKDYKHIKFIKASGARSNNGHSHDIMYLKAIGKMYSEELELGYFKSTFKKLQKMYGNRVKSALSRDDKIDMKSLYHAKRIVLELHELLDTSNIQFPLSYKDDLKNIKNGNVDPQEVIGETERLVEEVEHKILINKHKFLDSSDESSRKFREDLILEFYGLD